MIPFEKDFRIEDMKESTLNQQTWKEFAQRFGKEAYLWMCKEVNGAKIYVPEIDTQLKPARLRAYPKKLNRPKASK